MIEAKIVTDSISDHEIRLTTLELIYPLFIHQDFLTHRIFSRNSSSSRAIPIEKVIQRITDNPAMFSHIGKNQPGMQAKEEVSQEIREKYERERLELRDIAISYALRWNKEYGIHKQVVSADLAPWVHMATVVTSTEWKNWEDLRDHQDARPEMKILAVAMKETMKNSSPRYLIPGIEWHLPYVKEEEKNYYNFSSDGRGILPRISTARCARVSYLTHDGQNPTIEKDFELYEKLTGSVPIHASPLEHPAYPMRDNVFIRNFRGWRQLRDVIE